MSRRLLRSITGKSDRGRISELDDAIHIKTPRSARRNVKRHIPDVVVIEGSARPPASTAAIVEVETAHTQEPGSTETGKPIPPSGRYDLMKFEQKYKAFVSAADDAGLIDELYHDDVVHWMDGIPMSKNQVKELYSFLLTERTERTVESFKVLDSTQRRSNHPYLEPADGFLRPLTDYVEGRKDLQSGED